jgi:hypothetical protein
VYPSQWVAIVDEVASSVQESIIGIGEIAHNLLHPFSIRLLGNPGNLSNSTLGRLGNNSPRLLAFPRAPSAVGNPNVLSSKRIVQRN